MTKQVVERKPYKSSWQPSLADQFYALRKKEVLHKEF